MVVGKRAENICKGINSSCERFFLTNGRLVFKQAVRSPRTCSAGRGEPKTRLERCAGKVLFVEAYGDRGEHGDVGPPPCSRRWSGELPPTKGGADIAVVLGYTAEMAEMLDRGDPGASRAASPPPHCLEFANLERPLRSSPRHG